MLLCIIVGGIMSKVDNILDKMSGDRIPQFLFIGGELVMSLPQGEFIYFPRGLPHMYLRKEELKMLLEANQDREGKVYGAGNIYMPKPKAP